MAVSVRLARPEEAAAVGELTAHAYAVDGFVPSRSDYASVLSDAATRLRDADLLVAEDEAGALLGTITFALSGTPYAQIARAGEAEFRMLAVAPAARRRGVAQALVEACIERGRAAGASALVLSSSQEMTGAHRLYERMGFTRQPERDWSPVAGVQLVAYALPIDHATR